MSQITNQIHGADMGATTNSDEMQTQIILDGDFKNHPFRGNQHVSARRESSAAGSASRRAKHAEKHGDAKAQAKAHKTAHYAHKAAAVEAKGVTKKYHETMAKFHGKRAGAKVLDSVKATGLLDSVGVLDAALVMGNILGFISKDGVTIGRANIAGGDGKSMIYVGADGDERVTPVNGGGKFYFTEDAADLRAMVAILMAAVDAKKADATQLPAGTLVGFIAAIALELRNLGWKTDPVREGYAAVSPFGGEVVMEPEAGGKTVEFKGSQAYARIGDDPAKVAREIDLEDYAANADFDHDGERVTDEDSPYDGKPLAFVRGCEILERSAEASGAVVNWGDFDLSLRNGQLFDAATHYGVSAQIGYGGEVLARASISEEGKITLYRGAGGEDVIASSDRKPQIDAAIAGLVAAIKPAEIQPEPEQVPAAPADNDMTRLDALKKLVSKEAIRSDDPEAIEKLKAKLAYLSAYSDLMRKANKLMRKDDKDGLRAMGFGEKLLEDFFKPDFAGRKGFPDYEMTNNNGEMRRTRLRIEQLQSERADQVQEPNAMPNEDQSEEKPKQPEPLGDVSYRSDDMFTTFVPNTSAGEAAWRIINATEGSEGGKVFNQHAESVIAQLQSAGYTVSKSQSNSMTKTEEDELAAELLGESADQAADRAYLNSLIDGTGDLLAEDTFAKLEPMFAKYAEGSEMFKLLEQAATVYGDAAVKAAQDALATPA